MYKVIKVQSQTGEVIPEIILLEDQSQPLSSPLRRRIAKKILLLIFIFLLFFSLLLIYGHSPLLTNKQLFYIFPLTMNRTVLHRTVTSKSRYVPNRDFCAPLHPYPRHLRFLLALAFVWTSVSCKDTVSKNIQK